MRPPDDGELDVIEVEDLEFDPPGLHHRHLALAVLPTASSIVLALLVLVLVTSLIGVRRGTERLRLDLKAAVADPCHWVDVSDVERATHAAMMNTTRTVETYQEGCVYSLFDSPTPTVIIYVDTRRNPLYQQASRGRDGTLTGDRLTAMVRRDLMVIVETPNSLGPSGSVTEPLAAEVAARLPK